MKKNGNRRRGRLIKRFLLGTAGVMFLLAVSVAGFFGVKGYQMYQEAVAERPISEIVENIRSQEGFTAYDELPQIYIDAVIAAEDKRFESHWGIDFLAIARAAWKDLITLSFKEGGSTITQQIAKNQLFTQEKRIERKAAEVFAAFALEKECSKKELFEMYVNSIYFGSGYYGIHDAAQGYFGKTPQELTDYECVLLAGLPNAPSVYSLNNSMELATRRMAVVLERMVKCDKLTAREAEELLKGNPAGG
ncbi:MAG: transglycosylase domain-containing protein [Lachnospiraceae bacterium]|nr:transglycosylase domain-containing protein [Lachnospiraceae bacterium]MCI9149575.1 transglycosylase domain-containing protein [Lachnospiraceae bacterium]